jgi:hypothetical protein
MLFVTAHTRCRISNNLFLKFSELRVKKTRCAKLEASHPYYVASGDFI